MTTVAFIGLGNMGAPMATNLSQAGHTVRGFDLVSKPSGIELADSAEAAAADADVVITSLPNGMLVDQVVTSLTEADPTPRLYIDVSTIAVSQAREIARKVAEAGSRFIDAPVSGGIVGATNGTLAFMVGGAEEDFAAAKPLLVDMGSSVTHCGAIGNGQAVKACNNMILAVHQIVLAEALVLGQRLGLDPRDFFEVISHATGNSWALSVNAPVPGLVEGSPANHEFAPGFAAALMLKDLNLAMQAAHDTGTDTALGRAATEQYAEFVEAGHGGLDFSAIISAVEASQPPAAGW
ncbi:3-hydroxyisobutyrate dehydrogenase [Corynebacterium liangguodongii]|uniref:3-hydroxyisobutyrate dehydrogenase n=1 Tax=Corynebacterium liangguodongii TaxID=2079535 RepID=A0A2S0WD94_9CORY|nr:3-hydroxyisobutyrate dehydrogenase [Corynebacterium liangguodongii]AWB83714.1 3-hydroxyisobutyrate dehydrogenase [Corynebacterium liangguodongii]PWB99476.1 3-hydroxyisobutyrate dehydrogenase [Corynebacterium liangguodongii]